ncbi:BEM_collapsed_G0037390.mRNA.1.CDS.1 [Saccharomyces cerevisiae]|nr:BEM_collapsed_G0037390.mRNA.1.CDS.1 [Saccharomyces cerevisiae]
MESASLEAYNKILRNSSSHPSCQLVIFVSCLNIDALCATKMLSLLFKKTIGTISDNEKSGEQSFRRDIYVLDAHRPWNLDNIFGSQIIRCFDDGTVDDTLGEQKEAYYKLLELARRVVTMSSQVRENDNNGGDDEATDADEVTDEDEEDEDETISNKRGNSSIGPNGSQKKATERSKSMNMKVFLEEYYSQGTTVVNSISAQIYSLLSAIGETNLSNLWLNILGTTSLDVAYAQVYNRLYPYCKMK